MPVILKTFEPERCIDHQRGKFFCLHHEFYWYLSYLKGFKARVAHRPPKVTFCSHTMSSIYICHICEKSSKKPVFDEGPSRQSWRINQQWDKLLISPQLCSLTLWSAWGTCWFADFLYAETFNILKNYIQVMAFDRLQENNENGGRQQLNSNCEHFYFETLPKVLKWKWKELDVKAWPSHDCWTNIMNTTDYLQWLQATVQTLE